MNGFANVLLPVVGELPPWVCAGVPDVCGAGVPEGTCGAGVPVGACEAGGLVPVVDGGADIMTVCKEERRLEFQLSK